MLGVVFHDGIARQVGETLRERGYLVGVVGDKVLRIVPPLNLTIQEIDGFLAALDGVLKNL